MSVFYSMLPLNIAICVILVMILRVMIRNKDCDHKWGFWQQDQASPSHQCRRCSKCHLVQRKPIDAEDGATVIAKLEALVDLQQGTIDKQFATIDRLMTSHDEITTKYHALLSGNSGT